MSAPLRRTILRTAGAALLAALAVSVAGGFRRYWSNRNENERLSQKVAEAEVMSARKKALLGVAEKDDELLEGEARRQLGLIGEGEIEFRFVPSKDGGPERMETSPDLPRS